jgi:hypothetical protein
MTQKEKAFELVNKVSYEMEQLPYSFCKALVVLMVKEIVSALIEYGEGHFELQNMDSEITWWYSVITEIDAL